MREIRSYGSVGERGGNEPLYPECDKATNDERRTMNGELLILNLHEQIRQTFFGRDLR